MTTDKNTVDAQLLAIEVMKAEFLRFFNGSVAQSPDELKARHERINTALADCGGLDGYWVSWLFNELEQRALEELRKLVLLAQTTDPDLLKDKYFNDLPAPLVSNIKALHAHLKGKGASILGNNAKSTKKTALENEIEYRANFFLKNPEPDYKGKVEKYRSSTLAECIKKHWANSREIPCENNVFPKPPSLGQIRNAIKSAVKKEELPAFLLAGKPKN